MRADLIPIPMILVPLTVMAVAYIITWKLIFRRPLTILETADDVLQHPTNRSMFGNSGPLPPTIPSSQDVELQIRNPEPPAPTSV